MPDNLTPEQRRHAMQSVKGKDTTPEKLVRSLLHRKGYRFRLHAKGLPGVPDVVLPRYRTVIFIHGCFWHQHPGCRKATIPVHRSEYWAPKLARNQERDIRAREELERLGWNVIVVWGCEIGVRKMEELAARLDNSIRNPDRRSPASQEPDGERP